MYSFNNNNGEYDLLDLSEFFNGVQKEAMNSGYELFILHGIDGMKNELGSRDPISIGDKLIKYFIRYEEYEKCAEIQTIIDNYKLKMEKKKL